MDHQKKYAWVLVGLLWGVALLNYMDRQMLSAMAPAMQIDIAELRSATNFGYLMAIFLWLYGFASPFSGIIADRLNRKWLIAGNLFIWSCLTFAMGYATTFKQLYWLRAVMGISEAFYIPAALSLIADYHKENTRSLATGIHMTGLYFGQALGGFGVTLATGYSWRTAFYSFGVAGILYSLILIIFLKEKKDVPEIPAQHKILLKENIPVFKNLALLFVNISFWIILFYFASSSMPGWAIKNWLPTLFAKNLDMAMSKAGPLSTITIACSSLLGVLFGGILSDKWVMKNSRGRIYTSSIGLALTIPSLLLIGYGQTHFHIILAAICFGLGFGISDANTMPILCQFVPARQRATAYGILNMTGVFAGALITNTLGKSVDGGNLGKGFALLAIVVLAAMIVPLYFLRPNFNDFADRC